MAAEVGPGLIDGVTFDLSSVSGIVTAFFFGLLTIAALLRVAHRIQFWKFCISLGGLSLLLLLLESL